MTEPTTTPVAVYLCEGGCCEHLEAAGLAWYSIGDAWMCDDCADSGGMLHDRGITLADYLARKQPAADLAGYPVDVVTMADAFGKWPGDETDDQIAEALGETVDELPALCEECTEEPCTNPLCPCADVWERGGE